MRGASLMALLALGALSAGCTRAPTKAAESSAERTEPAAAAAVTQATYTCDNGVKLTVSFPESGNAIVKAGDMAEMELKGVIAASGNRFTDGHNELWTKGMDEALWTVGRTEPAHCTAP